MGETRIGRQTPTISVVLPYSESRGAEAVQLYNSTGKKAQEWQELLLFDILATNESGLWTHTKFGYAVPRRNGKNEVVVMRELFGLMDGQSIMHTAHRTSTSHSAWERLDIALYEAGIEHKSTKQFGLETITVPSTGGRAYFRTRSSKGGLGEGFDLLVIDEAQEYTDDQESALKYVISASKNPQTIFCGTPPTTVSAGTVFLKLRNYTLAGGKENTGWAEWSVEKQSDPNDVDLWYETNPSLGVIISERSVRDEIGDDVIDFNIQRLGLWIKYNQKSAISKKEWQALKCDKLPKLEGKLHAGVKFGHDGQNVALSIAVKTTDGKIFVETIDCRPARDGCDWIVSFLRDADVMRVVADGASGKELLTNAMKEAGIKKAPIFLSTPQVIAANATFEQGFFANEITHMDQPSLTQSVSNCSRRAIGSNGGFGYKSTRDDIEIALMDSMIYAFWACHSKKQKKKQKIYSI